MRYRKMSPLRLPYGALPGGGSAKFQLLFDKQFLDICSTLFVGRFG